MNQQAPVLASKDETDALLEQALATLIDARDCLLVIRAAIWSLSKMPADHAMLSQMALYKTVDHMAGHVMEAEQRLIAEHKKIRKVSVH